MRRNKPIPFKRKDRFAFIVDGECEFWYLQMLKRNERSISINLEPKIPQKKKLSEQYELVIELSEDYNVVYWIIDFDVIENEKRSAKSVNKTAFQEFREYFERIQNTYKNIHIIINNPCLEFWFLLHFESTSKYYDKGEQIISHLKKSNYLPDYDKTQKYFTKQNNDIYLKLRPHLKKAIENSNKLSAFDFQNPHSGLSQMQIIFESDKLKMLLD